MTIRVLVNGSDGRMGQEVVKAVQNDPTLQLCGTAEKNDNLQQKIQQTNATVVVDFTVPEAVFDNTLTILAAGAHPVIGTTGLRIEQIEALQQRSQQLKRGGIIAPNFSIGAILMMKFAKDAAHYLPDVEIIELHHPGKLDSPSGTAIKTAEMIALNRVSEPTPISNRETIAHARGATHHHIAIHSVRLPGLVAHQQVIFGGTGETLTIRHDTIHRECFMPGIILACKKVIDLDHLIYGLEHLL